MLPLGSDSSSLVFSVSCLRMLVVSTTGAAPLTVIVSDNDPTCIAMFTVAVNPEPRVMPSRFTVENPSSANVTV